MNMFKAAWCRLYQACFRAAYPFLPYREPEALDSLLAIPAKLKELGIDSALIVTDASLRRLGMTAPLETAMEEAGLACHVYDGTVPNPTVATVEEALAIYKAGNCGAIIGIGGGASMDCAKVVGARAVWPRRSVQSLGGNLRILRRLPPIIAVPTTAGTGSEATLAAVIVDETTHHKFTLNDFSLIPRYAVLDPHMTVGLPPFFTATTGMDALVHAVEAYIGRNNTKQTRSWSVEAVQIITTYLERAYRDGHDMEARRQMSRAAYLAGMAFARSYVGYCHAVSHSLSGMYNTPHGLANAVLLPYILRAYGKSVYKPLKNLAIAIGIADEDTPPAAASERFIRKVESMNRAMDIPDKLSGIRAEDIELLSRRADGEGNPLYPVPRLMDAAELQKFYVMVADNLGENEEEP
ncbi:MAG: iron-containing alcohol dehydrogenase [Oscillospiraceae bacterium]